MLATTSPTQLGFPRKLVRILEEFVLGRKPMKRMRLPQDCIFSHAFHFFRPKSKKFTHLPLDLRIENSKNPQCLSEISVPKPLENARLPNEAKSLRLSAPTRKRSALTRHMKILPVMMILRAQRQDLSPCKAA